MRFRLRFIVGTALIVAAVGYLIVTAIQTTAEYYLTVNEVAARQGELHGVRLRVAGRVKPGTINWQPETLTLKFDLIPIPPQNTTAGVKTVAATDPPEYAVTCVGEPKPDMLSNGRDVIVEGKLDSAGHIAANQVLTSCPSKYKAAYTK